MTIIVIYLNYYQLSYIISIYTVYVPLRWFEYCHHVIGQSVRDDEFSVLVLRTR